MSERVRRRLKAERPGAIIRAALEAFSANGFAATRLDDVAARAGITKGTIYNYFPSKEDLFAATLTETIRPVLDHLRALAADADVSALDSLRQHLAFMAERMIEDPGGRDIVRILLSEGHRFPTLVDRWSTEILDPMTQALTAVLRRGVERGEFGPSAVQDFPHLVVAPVFLCHNWQVLFGARRPLDIRRFFDTALDLLAHGLLRR